MKPVDILTKMKKAYKGYAPGRSTIYKWYGQFMEGRKTFDDNMMSGRPLKSEDNNKI